MPEMQTSYSDRQPTFLEGQKVDGREYDAETMICQGAPLAFGRPVARGGADKQCILLTAANAAKFKGVTVRDVSVRPSAGGMYPVGGNVTVLTKGPIAVRVTGAVSADDVARFDTAAERFTAAAEGGDVVAFGGDRWKFDSAAADGGLAVLIKV
jgi:hypothetical protein